MALSDACEEEGLVRPVDAPAKSNNSSFFSAQAIKKRFINETNQCVMATVILIVTVGGCVLCFLFCPPCLLGIIILGICLCFWAPYYNIPVYVSIVLLIYWVFMTLSKRFELSLREIAH